MPDNFCTSADGLLFISNGIHPVQKWDGLTDELEPAGIIAPQTALTMAASGTGSITGTYYAYSRFVDDLGNVSDLAPLSVALVAASAGTITYTAVPLPAQPKVVRRQILRNTAGQTAVFYVDVDTADLTSTSFQSTKTDTLLSAEEALALFDSQSRILGNLHAPPPDFKVAMASHLDRLFAAGEEPYTDGAIAVAAGATTIQGAGTEWPASFAGRFVWVPGGDRPYEVLSVDEDTQVLTLTEAYGGTTLPYAEYSIRPAIAERRLVYFSEAGQPESWPATNAVTVQEDGDEIAALMPLHSFLYILCRRHSYKLTFQDGPNTDGFIFLSAGRGVVNNKSWVVIDEVAYLLDEAGAYRFTGGEAEDLSGAIQDLFEPARRGARYRIRWTAARWFHACHDPGRQAIRFFVTLTGSGLPRHAICYDLARGSWWIEEYPFPVGASCVGILHGERRVFLGGPGGHVYVLGTGSLDLADPDSGTIRGTVTSSAPCSLTDLRASFAGSLVGSPVVIVAGRGKGQMRKVTGVTAATLTLDRPWLVRPDDGSTYQLGGIRYGYRTGWFRWLPQEDQNPRGLEVQFEPLENEALLDCRLYQDRAKESVEWDCDRSGEEAAGFASVAGETDLTADMARGEAFAQRRFDGRKERYIDGPRLASFELAGVTGREDVRIYQVSIDGVMSPEAG